jgi:hypothetical protein
MLEPDSDSSANFPLHATFSSQRGRTLRVRPNYRLPLIHLFSYARPSAGAAPITKLATQEGVHSNKKCAGAVSRGLSPRKLPPKNHPEAT